MRIPSSRSRIVPALMAAGFAMLFAGGARGAEPSSPAFKTVPFDQAMKDQIIRSLPLQLAFPADYEMAVLEPAINGVVWARPADLEVMLRTGVAPADAGFFRGRLTMNVGYDDGTKSFVCGPRCDETELKARIEDTGVENVTLSKQARGVPTLLIEADTGSMPGAARKRLYMAYVATLIDTNVMLISYRAPAESADDGRSVWRAFGQALTDSAADATVGAAPQGDFGQQLETAAHSREFQSTVDVFIAAARGGDAMTSFELVSPSGIAGVGHDVAWQYLTSKVLPFFAEFGELGRSTTIAPASDFRGNAGFVFHMTMKTNQGGERPFSIYMVEENGERVIVNVLLDHDFRTARN